MEVLQRRALARTETLRTTTLRRESMMGTTESKNAQMNMKSAGMALEIGK